MYVRKYEVYMHVCMCTHVCVRLACVCMHAMHTSMLQSLTVLLLQLKAKVATTAMGIV